MTKSNGGRTLDDFRAELDRLSINFSAITGQPFIPPKAHSVAAHHWSWGELERLLHESLDFQEQLPTGPVGAERRIIRLQNPALDGETVTDTMSMALQLLMPGEFARPHRHSTVAVRLLLKGEAFTTVDDEKCVMRPGDLVLTPYMRWHEHGNESDQPAIWIDGLDFPLVRYLEALVKQDEGAPRFNVTRTGTADRRYGTAGLRPAWHTADDTDRFSLIHYRWEDTEAALNAMAEAEDASPTDDVILEYVNPATAQPVFKTIACYAQMIRPGIRTVRQRETAHKVYHVLRGSGQTVVGDLTFNWSQGDFFVVPSMAWHEHANGMTEPSILFSLQDGPTLKRLGLYMHETSE